MFLMLLYYGVAILCCWCYCNMFLMYYVTAQCWCFCFTTLLLYHDVFCTTLLYYVVYVVVLWCSCTRLLMLMYYDVVVLCCCCTMMLILPMLMLLWYCAWSGWRWSARLHDRSSLEYEACLRIIWRVNMYRPQDSKRTEVSVQEPLHWEAWKSLPWDCQPLSPLQ